jgi:Acetoacetate decarboxylase (ADC)
MTNRQPIPPDAVLVAIDIAKVRNEVLIEASHYKRRRRLSVLNTRDAYPDRHCADRLCPEPGTARERAPIAGGREIWGFPKKLAKPKIAHESETLVCTLHSGSVLCVSATMGYKHHELDPAPLLKSLAKPSFMIKIIAHVDCTPRICELERYIWRASP